MTALGFLFGFAGGFERDHVGGAEMVCCYAFAAGLESLRSRSVVLWATRDDQGVRLWNGQKEPSLSVGIWRDVPFARLDLDDASYLGLDQIPTERPTRVRLMVEPIK